MSGLLISKVTPEFRVSFPKVFEPELNKLSGKVEYKLVAMIDKAGQASPEYKELREAILKCIVDEWGSDKTKWPKKLMNPLHDGNVKYNEDNKKYAMYKDVVHINLKSKDKPVVRTPDNKNYITDQNEFYGGCYARASVNIKAFKHPANQGVALYLNGVIKTRDGEAFGGRVNVEEQFESVAVASSAEDNMDGLFGDLPPATKPNTPPSSSEKRAYASAPDNIDDVETMMGF